MLCGNIYLINSKRSKGSPWFINNINQLSFFVILFNLIKDTESGISMLMVSLEMKIA